jgi:hypothetical protein
MPHVMDTMQELRELSGKKVILFCFLIIVSYTAYFFYFDKPDLYPVFWRSRKAEREHAGEMLPLQV